MALFNSQFEFLLIKYVFYFTHGFVSSITCNSVRYLMINTITISTVLNIVKTIHDLLLLFVYYYIDIFCKLISNVILLIHVYHRYNSVDVLK